MTTETLKLWLVYRHQGGFGVMEANELNGLVDNNSKSQELRSRLKVLYNKVRVKLNGIPESQWIVETPTAEMAIQVAMGMTPMKPNNMN